MRARRPGRGKLRAKRQHVQHRHRGRLLQHQAQHLQRGGIGPLQVFPRHQHRLPLGFLQHPGHQRIEGLLLLPLRGQGRGGIAPVQRHREQGREQRHHLVERQAIRAQALLQLGEPAAGASSRCTSSTRSTWVITGYKALCGDTPNSERRSGPPSSRTWARSTSVRADLPMPAAATEQHHLPEALLGLRPAPPQQPCSSSSRPTRKGTPATVGWSALGLQRPAHPKHRHGRGDPFEGMPPQVVQPNRLPHQARRHRADHHVGRRQPFQARRNVHCVPGGQMLMPPPTAHFSHHHGSGMDTDPYRQLHALLPLQTGIERRGDRRDNAQPRMHAAQGIVFVRHRPTNTPAPHRRDTARCGPRTAESPRRRSPDTPARPRAGLRRRAAARAGWSPPGRRTSRSVAYAPPPGASALVPLRCRADHLSPGVLRRFSNRRRHAMTRC